MSRKALIVAAALAVAVIAAIVVLPGLSQTAPIEERALGTWRETGVKHPIEMVITPGTHGGDYYVLYRRYKLFAEWANLRGQEIHVWGENSMSPPMYMLTYDAGSDKLTATGNLGTVRFARVTQ